jgi:hypothetical protein
MKRVEPEVFLIARPEVDYDAMAACGTSANLVPG